MKIIHHPTNKTEECMNVSKQAHHHILSLGSVDLSMHYMMYGDTVLCENCFDTNIITKNFR